MMDVVIVDVFLVDPQTSTPQCKAHKVPTWANFGSLAIVTLERASLTLDQIDQCQWVSQGVTLGDKCPSQGNLKDTEGKSTCSLGESKFIVKKSHEAKHMQVDVSFM